MKIDFFFTYHMTAFNNYFLSSAHYGKSWIFDKNVATFEIIAKLIMLNLDPKCMKSLSFHAQNGDKNHKQNI